MSQMQYYPALLDLKSKQYKLIYIIDKFIATLCKESHEYNYRTTSYKTNCGIWNPLSCKLTAYVLINFLW